MTTISSVDDSTPLMPIWESDNDDEDMLFPIHKCCLTLMERLCHSRKAYLPQMHTSNSTPADLKSFCDTLRRRREKNQNRTPQEFSDNYYYSRSGGLEWEHEYYGARQSWVDEWENKEGGEVHIDIGRLSHNNPFFLICQSGSVQTLSAFQNYHLTSFRKSTNDSSATITAKIESIEIEPLTNTRTSLSNMPTEIISAICADLPFLSVIALRKTCKILRARVNFLLTLHFWRTRLQAGEVLLWLLPGEFDDEEARGSYDCDWEERFKALNAMTRDIGPHESKYEEVMLEGARPIGLENRWRIWKVLQGMRMDGEEL